MKNIIRIYKRDIKNIVTNWVALVIVLGLIILPSLYAWFNIKSSWDPYSNTKGILVAVVNKDRGGSYKEIKINIGDEIIKELKNNNKIGWNFVNEKEAEWGVTNGKYYASLTIPEDFSSKMLSIVGDNPTKPSLIYSINEKRNAVAPKITDKGISTVQNEVTKDFVKTVNGIIFNVFNKLGVELEKGKPKLKDLTNMIFYIDSKIPDINNDIDKLEKGAITLEEFINKIQKDIPLIKDTINRGLNVLDKGEIFLQKFKTSLDKIAPYIKEDLIIAKNITSTAENIMEDGINLIKDNSKKSKEILSISRDKFIKSKEIIQNIIDLLNSINKDRNNNILNSFINNLSNVENRLNDRINSINKVINIIDKGEKPSVELLNTLKNKALNVTPILNNIIDNFDSKILPAINNVVNELNIIANNTTKLLKDTKSELPAAENLLNETYEGSKKGINSIKIIKNKLPSIEKSIHEVAGKLRKLDDDEKLNEIIKIMKKNANIESDFISNPIEIKENRIYPIPNYGSAMAPFFTTLSLWVGALILVSILSVNVLESENIKNLRIQEKYFGRYLTFMTIAVLQALVVSLGDIFLLKVYVKNKIIFVVLSIFISIVFSMIVYTLVSVFKNVGKALAVILLVLQISSSGGTFPIEMTPPFFQKINPLLPFTYAIAGMREAVGGVIKTVLLKNVFILSIYFVLSLILSFLLKKKLEGINEKFVEKFKESGLVEE
ncbi:YhgE/Pip domain-containing protein [Clostridium niameyense]|uniref:YhgE/Pip domain-containing protein n=1 Tax=Clostridium niameyense TaxID=1622073 RepID=UPI00067F287E|nr:YhgE/Pip domain-containing protein [Clostridium niameyense]